MPPPVIVEEHSIQVPSEFLSTTSDDRKYPFFSIIQQGSGRSQPLVLVEKKKGFFQAHTFRGGKEKKTLTYRCRNRKRNRTVKILGGVYEMFKPHIEGWVSTKDLDVKTRIVVQLKEAAKNPSSKWVSGRAIVEPIVKETFNTDKSKDVHKIENLIREDG